MVSCKRMDTGPSGRLQFLIGQSVGGVVMLYIIFIAHKFANRHSIAMT